MASSSRAAEVAEERFTALSLPSLPGLIWQSIPLRSHSSEASRMGARIKSGHDDSPERFSAYSSMHAREIVDRAVRDARRPARRHRLQPRIEAHAFRPVDRMVAEQRTLPAAEG